MNRYLLQLITLLMPFLLALASCSSPEYDSKQSDNQTYSSAESTTTIPVKDCLDFAASQLEKTVLQVADSNSFPRYVNAEGRWETLDSHAWSSGFFPGCLWFMYEYTGADAWKEHAMAWTAGMEGEKFNRENHNNGFMMMSSFGNGHRLTGRDDYREVLIESARSLATRFNKRVGMIKANEMDLWEYPVMVDTMVNIELLFHAASLGGDPEWVKMAETHARNTIAHHIRADGGTIQVVDFDPVTGNMLKHDTLCGLSGDSTWSRGQGQALYGFAVAYRETGKQEFLKTAIDVADYLIDHLPEDSIPWWDNNDPAIPNVVRDSSAAAIACVGLLELQKLVDDSGMKTKYLEVAEAMLASLCSTSYLADASESAGIITHATWKKPTDPQADTSLIWGDYSFIEALLKYHEIRR